MNSDKTVLVLSTCDEYMKSWGWFTWPQYGPVTEPYGVGLLGLARGVGYFGLLDLSSQAKWLVLEVNEDELVEFYGKVKFSRAFVRYAGCRATAVKMIAERYPDLPVHFAVRHVGDRGRATVGHYGHATAGVDGHAEAGYGGHAIAGYNGHAVAGDYGHAVTGYYGRAIAGHGGHATAGYGGRAETGDHGHATAGHYGRAIAGHGGIATAGDLGIAIAGECGRAHAGPGGSASAGEGGVISIAYLDQKQNRIRIATARVGEDGIEPGVPYVLDGAHKFVRRVENEKKRAA